MKQNHVLLALVGDIEREVQAKIKYGLFAQALTEYFGRVTPCDVTLQGVPRFLNALQTFNLNPQKWREKFWKNLPAFDKRSHIVSKKALKFRPDLILQIGVTFDSTRYQSKIPVYLYTDYTAALSARRKEHERSPFNTIERKLWFAWEQETYQRASHIFVRSAYVQNSLISDYKISPEKITICGGGVNIDPLPELPTRLVTENPKILFIGKEFKRKGGDLLLQAFDIVLQEFPEAKLHIITGEKILPHLSVKNVKIEEPIWDRRVILDRYRNANIFVLPSRLETWGDVLLEAMALGLPCIGVDSDAMSEIILNEQTGVLVSAGNVQSLANAILKFIKDPQKRLEMGTLGRIRVEKEFTWKSIAAKINATIIERTTIL